MQRLLGQQTAACFQRCVGMDAFNSLYPSTCYETSEKHGTDYFSDLLKKFMFRVQDEGPDRRRRHDRPEGRSLLAPLEQADPDMYLGIVERHADGIVVRGAKAHQTGAMNSH